MLFVCFSWGGVLKEEKKHKNISSITDEIME